MLLETHNIRLIPFSSDLSPLLQEWYMDGRYNDIFRHSPKILSAEEFKNYPQRVNGDIFIVYHKKRDAAIGFVQASSDWKTNRGFYFGVMLTEDGQHLGILPECIGLTFDYYFNRLGYNKAIMEILETRQDIAKWLTDGGFTLEGTFNNEVFLNGKFETELRYSIIAEDFNKQYSTLIATWKV